MKLKIFFVISLILCTALKASDDGQNSTLSVCRQGASAHQASVVLKARRAQMQRCPQGHVLALKEAGVGLYCNACKKNFVNGKAVVEPQEVKRSSTGRFGTQMFFSAGFGKCLEVFYGFNRLITGACEEIQSLDQ